jgi:ribose-phosphate pyrophosphokinase
MAKKSKLKIKSNFHLAAGRSNTNLAHKIAKSVERKAAENKANIDCAEQLEKTIIRNFSDGEIWVKYEDSIRGGDLFIVQSTHAPGDNLVELLMLIDAARRASTDRITAVIPYFGYARQDRKDQPRVSITAKLMANLIVQAGADHIITMDLHVPQIQGFFDVPLDHLYASTVLVKKLRSLDLPNLVIASPDVGGAKTARAYAKRLNAGLILIDKRRPAHNVSEVFNIIGDPKGKNVIIVDDLIDTAGTFVACAKALKDAGAEQIIGACTHPVFSGKALERIESSVVSKLYVTDTIAQQNPLFEKSAKIATLSVADLFAEAILRTHNDESITSLFDIDLIPT